MSSADYARVFRLHSYKKDRESYISENFRKSSILIDSFKVLNEDIDSLALQQKFNFIVPIDGSGEYKFIPMTFFSGFETNPFCFQ